MPATEHQTSWPLLAPAVVTFLLLWHSTQHCRKEGCRGCLTRGPSSHCPVKHQQCPAMSNHSECFFLKRFKKKTTKKDQERVKGHVINIVIASCCISQDFHALSLKPRKLDTSFGDWGQNQKAPMCLFLHIKGCGIWKPASRTCGPRDTARHCETPKCTCKLRKSEKWVVTCHRLSQ